MTHPAAAVWPPGGSGFRRSEVTAIIGNGDSDWGRVAGDVLLWKVKTESGFTVDQAGPVEPGQRVMVSVRPLGVTVLEPVQVVDVVKTPDRVGFSYRTLPGHPVSGEEAFIVHRQDDVVYLTIRSLTKAAAGQPWRALFPVLLMAQSIVRRRYLRALR